MSGMINLFRTVFCPGLSSEAWKIGEASKKIHPDYKAKYPLVGWKEMAGMRDRLIHHYF